MTQRVSQTTWSRGELDTWGGPDGRLWEGRPAAAAARYDAAPAGHLLLPPLPPLSCRGVDPAAEANVLRPFAVG